MRDAVALERGGEALRLLGERALYWPSRRRLLIADLHLGKAALFRRAGIALPRGGTADDLLRLSALLDQTGAQALWILGDVLHGLPLDAAVVAQWRQWRARHPQLHVGAIAGNHDRGLARAPLDLELIVDGYREAGLVLRHAPAAVAAGTHLICGHLHPQVRIPGIARRWPAFWLRADATLLPAFSRFTGGVVVQPAAQERMVACVEGQAILLPSPSPSPSPSPRRRRGAG